jgi:hypothetical protein
MKHPPLLLRDGTSRAPFIGLLRFLGHCFAIFVLGIFGFCPKALQAQHIHVNAGATSTGQDAPLYFSNGDVYDTNAGYDVSLAFTNSGSFSNLYQGAGVTFCGIGQHAGQRRGGFRTRGRGGIAATTVHLDGWPCRWPVRGVDAGRRESEQQ